MEKEKISLRTPFPKELIGKLPRETKAQKEDINGKIRCPECKGWHHKNAIHLDYVGHAALTDRLLDVDPNWSWEPFAVGEDGLPKFDVTGGLWIKLTVLGITRIGYGHAESSRFKEIGAREKEVIGDALRNAAMRFGAALDLWHKGDLHGIDEDDDKKEAKNDEPIKMAPETKPNPIKDMKRDNFWKMLVDLYGDDAAENLEKMTQFKGKDGSMVRGKRDVNNLSDKQLGFLFKKVESEHKKIANKISSIQESPSDPGGPPDMDEPPPYTDDDLPF